MFIIYVDSNSQTIPLNNEVFEVCSSTHLSVLQSSWEMTLISIKTVFMQSLVAHLCFNYLGDVAVIWKYHFQTHYTEE